MDSLFEAEISHIVTGECVITVKHSSNFVNPYTRRRYGYSNRKLSFLFLLPDILLYNGMYTCCIHLIHSHIYIYIWYTYSQW